MTNISISFLLFLLSYLWYSSICIVALACSHDTNSGKVCICSGTWVVCFLYVCDLVVFWEGNMRFRLFGWVFSVVVARSWVKMRVWYSKVPSDIGANPISDVSLVHRVHIHFVFAWAWHVEVLCARSCLHAEAELGVLARPVIWSSWVSEIEIASDLVVAWPWHSQVLRCLLTDLSVFSDVLVLNDGSHTVSSRVTK